MPDDTRTAEWLDWQMRELVSCLRTDPCAYDHTCANHRTFHDLLTRYGDARALARAEEDAKLAYDWPAECLTGSGEENCGPGIAEAIRARAGKERGDGV